MEAGVDTALVASVDKLSSIRTAVIKKPKGGHEYPNLSSHVPHSVVGYAQLCQLYAGTKATFTPFMFAGPALMIAT